jgi:hypothetical protein
MSSAMSLGGVPARLAQLVNRNGWLASAWGVEGPQAAEWEREELLQGVARLERFAYEGDVLAVEMSDGAVAFAYRDLSMPELVVFRVLSPGFHGERGEHVWFWMNYSSVAWLFNDALALLNAPRRMRLAELVAE